MSVKVPAVSDGILRGNMSETEINVLRGIKVRKSVPKLKNIIKHGVLHDFQTIAVAMAYFNKRFMLGDKPGLGKTVEVAGLLQLLKNKNELGKVLMFTPKDAVTQIADKLEFFTDLNIHTVKRHSSKGYTASLEKFNFFEHDVLLAPRSALTTNAFATWLSTHLCQFNMLILDESRVLKNNKAKLYDEVYQISKEMDRVIFMNGTVMEMELTDLYNQMECLNPDLLWRKTEFMHRYAKQAKTKGFMKVTSFSGATKVKFVPRFSFYDYNREMFPDLKEKLSVHMLIRSKDDTGLEYLPPTIEPIMCEMSSEHRALTRDYGMDALILNSPMTSDLEIDPDKLDKFIKLKEIAEELFEANEKIVVYSHYKLAGEYISEILKLIGFNSRVINGDTKDKDRVDAMREFNDPNGSVNAIVTSIEQAVDLGAANFMILYDVPYNPATFLQVAGRIDRNNYDAQKHYYILVYDKSSELDNIMDLLVARAGDSTSATGTDYQLIEYVAYWFNKHYPEYKLKDYEKMMADIA